MLPNDATDLLDSLWKCVERAADLEEQLRHAADEVAAWQAVARAGMILEVEDVSKHFGALAALTKVSFAVAERQVFSVIGPNGAGKSTLFNVIAGLHRPTTGSVRLAGRDTTGLPPEAVNRLGLAKTFQITNLFPEISVLDNVRVAAQSRSPESGRLASLWRRPDVDDTALALLEAFGLARRRDELAENLSHGEQRYLEICLALATSPRLLPFESPVAPVPPQPGTITRAREVMMTVPCRTLGPSRGSPDRFSGVSEWTQ